MKENGESSPKNPSHFQGKTPIDHLVDARKKGSFFTQETHGSEISGHVYALFLSVQEIVALYLILLPCFTRNLLPFYPSFLIIFLSYALWRTSSSLVRGYAQLRRLHKLIEEEHWEITHHREQEREELYALYEAKGFSGPILDEIITTLMSDDNRLLEVMLTEEIGLKRGIYDHPLQAGVSAFFASVSAPLLLGACFVLVSPIASAFCALLLLALIGFASGKKEKAPSLTTTVWLLSSAIFLHVASHLFLSLFYQG